MYSRTRDVFPLVRIDLVVLDLPHVNLSPLPRVQFCLVSHSSAVAARVVSAGRGVFVPHGQQRVGAGAAGAGPRQGGCLPVALRPSHEPRPGDARLPRHRLGPGGGRTLPRLPAVLRLGERSVLKLLVKTNSTIPLICHKFCFILLRI